MMSGTPKVYSEKSFEGKKFFHLNDDYVWVYGTVFLSSNFELKIKLSELDPNSETFFIRSKAFFSGLWMAMVSFVTVVVLLEAFNLNMTNHSVILFNGFGICGILLMAATYRKIKYIQFRNANGVPVLAIGKSGPEKETFEEFVTCIRNKVESKNIT